MSKKNLKRAIKASCIFMLGVIVTVIVTKIGDKLSPDKPIIIKEVVDSIRIIHEYNLPVENDSETIRDELLKKIRNIKMLNKYENQLKNYEKSIAEHLEVVKKISNDSILFSTPNLVIPDDKYNVLHRGYTQGQSTTYFETQCPDLNKGEFINFRFKFFNDDIVSKIACLRVSIYKYKSDKSPYSLSFILDEIYEPRRGLNYIKIRNDLDKGKYEIQYGFLLTGELENEYPTFYMKKCVLIKN